MHKNIVSDWWPGLCINFHINLFFQPVPLTAVFSLSVLKKGRVNKKEYALVLPAAWGKEFDKYFVFVDLSGLDSAAVSIFVIILVEWQILYQYLSVQPIYLQILRRQCCLVWICYSFHFDFISYSSSFYSQSLPLRTPVPPEIDERFVFMGLSGRSRGSPYI